MSSLNRDWNPVRAQTSIRSHFPGMDPMKTTKLLTAIALSALGALVSVSAADAPAKKPWVYQPVERPAIPAVKNSKWVRTPIDAFVLAKLEAANLAPSKEADRATFIRRATLDTWGLLPTPDEVRAFEKDHSKDAYEQLVERLLASPRYGERWGRRWLDLSRYADSDGYNGDGPRPNIWRYRDYVIQSFNDDKPFDRFVKEQIAGDELWPDDHEALIATGFLRNFPDEINARDLNLKKQEVANDLTDTVGTVLLGSTVGCAQCHNHKFDKISQKEYYQLQAYFVNTSWVDDVPAATAQEVADYEKKKAKYEAATKEIQAKMDAILQPVIDKLEDDRIFGFVPETRVSITKPEGERTAYDRWIYHRNLWTMQGRTRNAVVRLKQKAPDKYVEYTDLEADLKKFDKLKPKELGAISTVFAEYLLRLLGKEDPQTVHYVAAGAILLVAVFNILGVKLGALVQNLTTGAKYGALIVLVLAAFLIGARNPSPVTVQPGALSSEPSLVIFGLAFISLLWVYDGWADVTFVSGEVRTKMPLLQCGEILKSSERRKLDHFCV